MANWQEIKNVIYNWLDENSDQFGVLLWQVETDTMPGYDTSKQFHKSSKSTQSFKDEDIEKLTNRILTTIKSNFNVQPIKNIGTGSLGVAYLVNSIYGKVVMKLTMDEKEAKVAGCLANSEGHPNVIKIYEAAKISKVGLYIILEEYGGESLSTSDQLKKLLDSIPTVEHLKMSEIQGAKEIYSAYQWLNNTCNFVWQDLHSDNIVKSNSTYKIIDIGNTTPGRGDYKELTLESLLDDIILINRIELL